MDSPCGNGSVEPPERCDDGNSVAGDACHPACVPSSEPLWTATHDAPDHQDDRAFDVAVDPERDAFYVTGYTTTLTASGTQQDLLVERRSLATGALVWSMPIDSGHGDDRGEELLVLADGAIVVVGEVATATGLTDAVVLLLRDSGYEAWRDTIDLAGFTDKAAGVAIDAAGRIVVGGKAGTEEGTPQAWLRWYAADRSRVDHEIIEAQPRSNEIIDVIADREGVQVTGYRTPEEGQALWTARYDGDGTLQWEHLATDGGSGSHTRGVGQAYDPRGGSAVAGVVARDIFVQRFAADGSPLDPIAVSGSAGVHDEAADVVFLPDGSFLVVGFVNFQNDDGPGGDLWMRHHTRDGQELWTREIDGPGRNLDKALAVELADDFTAVVVGYVTVPGQSRDLWLGRFVL